MRSTTAGEPPSVASMFDPFAYRDGVLCESGRPVSEIAETFGTPAYIYSRSGLLSRYDALAAAFAPLRPRIHFASKSCANIRILRMLAERGAGIDAVSAGEVERAWLAGCPMDRVAFAGVGKTEAELRAALSGSHSTIRGEGLEEAFGVGPVESRGTVGLFNVESEGEYERLDALARELGVSASVAVRVNPDVDAKTHPYTTTGRKHNKFGIDLARAESLYAAWSRRSGGAGDRPGEPNTDRPGARPVGLHVHIGSPVYDTEPFAEATRVIVDAASRLRDAGAPVEVLDLGGGWPSPYRPEQQRDLHAFAEAVEPALRDEIARGTSIRLEPGRSIVANAALLLTRVQYVKRSGGRRFVITDAGMQTLLRPALYGAEHAIWPVEAAAGPFDAGSEGLVLDEPTDVVGPICETGDFLARDRRLPEVNPGDLLAVFSAGAYGMSMASSYNQHRLPCEVLMDDAGPRLIRRRQTAADLIAPEVLP